MELLFTVRQQTLTYVDTRVEPRIGSENYLTAKFLFTSKDWNTMLKTVQFSDDQHSLPVLLEGESVPIPDYFAKQNSFNITLLGSNGTVVIPTNVVTMELEESNRMWDASSPDGEIPDYAQSAYVEILNKSTEAVNTSNEAKEIAQGVRADADKLLAVKPEVDAAAQRAEEAKNMATQKAQEADSAAIAAGIAASDAANSVKLASDEVVKATEQANNAKSSAEAAAGEVTKAQAEVGNAQKEVQKAADEVAKAKTEVQNAQTEVQNAKAEVTKAKAEVTKATEQATKATQEADRAAGEVDNAKVEVVNASNQADRSKSEADRAEIAADKASGLLNDSKVSTESAWSSKQTVDRLCLPFSASGPIATCHPVEGYPLGVVSTITPVQEGSGDPSPDNVRPIKGWSGATVTRCGKNVCDFGTKEFTTQYSDNMGVTIPPGTYTISAEVSSTDTDTDTCLVGFFTQYLGTDIEYVWLNRTKAGERTSAKVVLDKPCRAIYLYAAEGYNAGLNDQAVFKDIQIEAGSVATPYEPYRGQDFTLPFGQTVYGGQLDWASGKLTVTKKSYVYGPDAPRLKISGDGTQFVWDSPYYINNIRVVSSWYPQSGYFIANGYFYRLYIDGSGFTTIDEFKAALAKNPMQVVIPAENPTTIQLTPTEILALSGVNNLYTDTGDTTATGREDPKATIKKLGERIAALEKAALGGI